MIDDVKQFLDRAELWQLRPDVFAQISIAISLQRIAEALERQPLMSAGIWDNTRISNPDMEFSTDKWKERWPSSVTPLTPELARAGMLVPVMDWQQVALNGGPPCFYVETNTPDESPRFCGRAERWQGHGVQTFHNFVSLSDYLTAAVSPVGDYPSIIVSQPATFESLAPTLLTGVPSECWCSAGPGEPVHDPKYGSHVFGETIINKSYGGTD